MENRIPYGLRITFLVHFVFAVVFGLVLLLVPEMYGGMMGAPPSVTTVSLFRSVGAALLAFGVSSWFAYRQPVWERVKIVVQMEIVWTILAVLVGLYVLIFEGFPAGYWMNESLWGFFAVAFIFFYSRRG